MISGTNHKAGFSLVEISLAILVMAVGLTVVVALFPAGLGQSQIALEETQAGLFAEDVFNRLQAMANAQSWSDFKADVAAGIPVDANRVTTLTGTILLDAGIHTNYYKLPGNTFDDHVLRYRINTNRIHSVTLCAIVNENQTLTLNAPAGALITSIDFVSYGTPSGNCTDGYFINLSCHSPISYSKIESLVSLPAASISIVANNSNFGDPCGGTAKKLAVEATASYVGGHPDWLVPVNITVWPGEHTTPTKEYKIDFYTEFYDSGL